MRAGRASQVLGAARNVLYVRVNATHVTNAAARPRRTRKRTSPGRRRCFPAPPPEPCGAPSSARTQAGEPSHSPRPRPVTWPPRGGTPLRTGTGTGTCPGALNLLGCALAFMHAPEPDVVAAHARRRAGSVRPRTQRCRLARALPARLGYLGLCRCLCARGNACLVSQQQQEEEGDATGGSLHAPAAVARCLLRTEEGFLCKCSSLQFLSSRRFPRRPAASVASCAASYCVRGNLLASVPPCWATVRQIGV